MQASAPHLGLVGVDSELGEALLATWSGLLPESVNTPPDSAPQIVRAIGLEDPESLACAALHALRDADGWPVVLVAPGADPGFALEPGPLVWLADDDGAWWNRVLPRLARCPGPVPWLSRYQRFLVGRLTKGAVHEGNNQLAVIRSCAAAGRLPGLDAEERRQAERDLTEATRVLERVASVRAAMADPIASGCSRTRIDELALRAARLVHNPLKYTARLQVELPEVPVYFDDPEGLLGFAVAHLLLNAAEHMDSGLITLRVQAGDTLTLRVEDSGRGLGAEFGTPDLLPGVGRCTSADHLGVGLYVAWRAAAAFGGSLDWADTGAGAAFEIRIPRSAPGVALLM